MGTGAGVQGGQPPLARGQRTPVREGGRSGKAPTPPCCGEVLGLQKEQEPHADPGHPRPPRWGDPPTLSGEAMVGGCQG